MNNRFLKEGYGIAKGVFSKDEISLARELSLEYFKNGGGFNNSTGRAKPDWIKEESLVRLKELIFSKNIDKIIERVIGEQVEFIGHNDLHINRNVGWHKDRLNNEARKFEVNSPWEVVDNQTMKIYKANIYLQDHSNNHDGLIVKSGTHLKEHFDCGKIVPIKPMVGDVVIFDQRITHMAQWSGGYDRLLICVGYGVKNCIFDQFKKGTEFRQNKQNGLIK